MSEDPEIVSSYGSFGPRSGYIGKEALQNRQDRSKMEMLESDDTKFTIRRYVFSGVVIAVLVTLACYILMGRVEAQLAAGMHAGMRDGPYPGDVSAGQGGRRPGDTPTADDDDHEASHRLYIRHLLQGPAEDEARSETWKQVEDWGRAHPEQPVRLGLVLILQTDPSKYQAIVTKQVEARLTSPSSCEGRSSGSGCQPNQVARSILDLACPTRTPACLQLVSSLARSEAAVAAGGAFAALRHEYFPGAPSPDLAAAAAAAALSPGFAGRAAASAYGQAAAVGLGQGPSGYQPAGMVPHGQRPATRLRRRR